MKIRPASRIPISKPLEKQVRGFTGGPVSKNPPANASDMSSIWEGPMCCRATKTMYLNY